MVGASWPLSTTGDGVGGGGGGGGAGAVYVTESVSIPTLPAASRALTVMRFVPATSAIAPEFQLVVPLAVPDPPRLLVQLTCVTPTLSELVPPSVIDVVLLVYDVFDVGDAMLIKGSVVSGGGCVGAAAIVHVNVAFDDESTPSDTCAVTENVPAVVPVPAMNPVFAISDTPAGSPLAV